jgi:hypothetical protein
MTVMGLTGASPGPLPVARRGRLPIELRGCRRAVVVTVVLPEVLLAAAGTLQRLDAVGVPIDLLELAWVDQGADRAAEAALQRLGLTGLSRHRLALPAPFGPDRTDDVIAATSELIGFDPEPGLVCLVPGPGDEGGPSHSTVAAAVDRLRGAYRMGLLSFAPVPGAPFTEVELDVEEWRAKCDSLALCTSEVTPLSGWRECFSA